MSSLPPVLSPAYRLVIRLEIANRPGMFAEVARTIGARGGSLGAIDLVEATLAKHVRDVSVDVPDEATGERLTTDLRSLEGDLGAVGLGPDVPHAPGRKGRDDRARLRSVFDAQVVSAIAKAVSAAARTDGVARRTGRDEPAAGQNSPVG